jgi:glucosamine 6-phosphate synthetase-like amidotransferase/phosphosugar isomerase protein
MNEQTENINAAFLEVTTKKVETMDKKITALEEKSKSISNNTETIQKLIGTMEELQNDVKSSRFPEEKIQNLETKLDANINVINRSLSTKVLHHHHIPKIIWIACGLFIVLALVCSAWYNTANKLDSYIANDTKYRQLKLDTAHTYMQAYLDQIDSLYNVDPDMRKNVLATEEEYRLNFDRLQRADRLREEAKDLEWKAKKK